MVLPLDKRFLSESDASRLYNVHNIKSDPDEFCPTCLKEGFYYWPTKNDRVECDCAQQLQYYKHYLNAGIGALYQRLDWADFNGDDDLIQLASTYLDNASKMVSRGMGMILLGDIGTGKTLFVNLLLKNLLHMGHSIFSVTFAGLIEMMTSGWQSKEEKEFFLKRVRKIDVLLIDDIGKEFKTKNDLGSSTFDLVLRSRVQEGKPTFITSNMTIEELEGFYGEAAMSLLKETSIIHQVSGSDYRQTAGQRKLQEVLGGLTRPIV